jgi:hypothetical protein
MMISFMRFGINFDRSTKAFFGRVILAKVSCRKVRSLEVNEFQDMKRNE